METTSDMKGLPAVYTPARVNFPKVYTKGGGAVDGRASVPNPRALSNESRGPPSLRKDGAQSLAERLAVSPSVAPPFLRYPPVRELNR